jgi:hypothetical protein
MMLTLIERTRQDKRGAWYGLFECACGACKELRVTKVTTGWTKSCGCLVRERARAGLRTTHGHAKRDRLTPTYRSWQNMMARCYKTTSNRFANYGGRGIVVCKRWHEYDNFLADMGERPGREYGIGRVDHAKAYSPSNARWELISENSREAVLRRRIG